MSTYPEDPYQPDDNIAHLPATVAAPMRHQMMSRPALQDLALADPTAAQDAEEGIDLRYYWGLLVKRKWIVLAVIALGATFAVLSTLMETPIYRSTATIQIERERLQVVQFGDASGYDAEYYDDEFVQTQIELLRSRSLAQRVVEEEKLISPSSLPKAKAPTIRSRLRAMLGLQSPVKDIEKPIPSATRKSPAGMKAAISTVRGGLTAKVVPDSRLVNISFDSPDPAFAARISNAVAEIFISSNVERRTGSSRYASKYIEERLALMRQKLEDSEKALVEYSQREQIVGMDEAGDMSTQNLTGLNAALANAQSSRIAAESRWRLAQSGPVRSLPEVIDNQLVQSLQAKRSELSSEYQDKLRLYKPAYPAMQQLQGQIDELERQIDREVQNVKDSLRVKYESAANEESLLQGQMQTTKDTVLDVQGRSIGYKTLKRDADTNRELYDGLLQQFKEIDVASGVQTNNISMVDRAEVPAYPFKPDMRRNVLLGLVAGLLLGIVAALMLEYLDDTIKGPLDVEKHLGIAVLGVIPKTRPEEFEQQRSDARSAFAEAYRSVRTALQFSTDHGVPRTLLVTSPSPAEGKSTTALTLAENFAQLGKRVLLIDADLRNPSLHKIAGVDNSQGLSSLLSGAAKHSEVLRQTAIPNLTIMPAGPLPPNPPELLAGPKMHSLLTVAAAKFDQVIIDSAPIMGLADAPILSSLAQGTLLVVEAGASRINVSKGAVKRVTAVRGRLVGAILTKHDARHSGYGYGYGYGYGAHYYSYGTEAARLPKT